MWHRHKRKDVRNPQFTLVCTLKGCDGFKGGEKAGIF